MLDIQGITKIYNTEKFETFALDSVSMRVEPGEFVMIQGPSGCGKSTLLAVLGLLDVQSAGKYYLDGIDTSTASIAERAHLRNEKIGFIFQSFNLILNMTVVENVSLPLKYRNGVSAAERDKIARALVEKVGLSHRAEHFPPQLSGGQQQRVAVARALVGKPSILLADEPTGNLDSKSGESVMELVLDARNHGMTVCMVSHDEQHGALADRILTLRDGVFV